MGILVLGVTLAAPAAQAAVPPTVNGSNSCIRLAERNGAVKVTRDGVVFYKETADPSRYIYGCLFDTERARVLERAGGGDIGMNGRYVAYYTRATEDYFDYVSGFKVTDLETGQVVSSALPTGEDPSLPCPATDTAIGHVVVRSDGAVAWIAGRTAAFCESRATHWQVRAIATPGGEATTLDVGPGIDPDSLALSADGASISWTRDGQKQSATLGQPMEQPGPANKCFEAAEQSDAVRLTRRGVIVREHKRGEIGPASGCLFATERVYPLRNAAARDFALEGRYAAYFSDTNPAENLVDEEFRLTDLTTGRVVTRVPAALTTKRSLSCRRTEHWGLEIVLRSDGAAAWTGGVQGAGCRRGSNMRRLYEVDTIAAPGRRSRRLDVGGRIDTTSLTKSRDGRRVSWVNRGKKRSARLGR
jgi:hypothetical protein